VPTDAHGPVELVALLASAGGLEALSTVLRHLPSDFPAAIVVLQHLGTHDSLLPTILRRQTASRVTWAQDGQPLAPGEVVVCPPGRRRRLEITPDRRCRLSDLDQQGAQRSDVLLASVARSYGPRSVAVVLSGSGHDGAAGTVAMRRAGAVVIAESPETAQYPSMPIAAARAGADLVVPVGEIGLVLADIVEGAPLTAVPSAQRFASGTMTAVEAQALELGDLTAAPFDGQPWPSPSQATNSAAARAELAGMRAAELRRRCQDLSAGLVATAQTVATARRRAQESRRRAQLAHQAAEEADARRGH
jgi:two-component system, chemotaxis family, protein-glutamate methylesterase/glutaminase